MSVYKSVLGKELIQNKYEEVLSNWPVDMNRIEVETTYGKTFVMESGDSLKETIILLHGSTSNSAMWISEIEKLSENYHVFTVDILGEPGKSDEVRMVLEDFPKWLDEVRIGLNIDQCHLIGNSLGGWLGLNYTKNFDKQVSSLVLIAPSGLADAKLSFLFKLIPLLFLGDFGIRKLLSLTYGNTPVPKEANDVMKLMMQHFKPRTGNLPILTSEELTHFKLPITLIVGRDDALLPSKKSAEILKNCCPQSKIMMLNKGHEIFDISNQLLEHFNSLD